jgi:hypothetical protein
MFEFLASLTNILVQAYVDHTLYDDSSKHKYINQEIFFSWANDCNYSNCMQAFPSW